MGVLDRFVGSLEQQAVHALELVGHDLVARTTNDVPIEEGTLRASWDVEVHLTPDGAEVVVSYNTPYAARQHEEIDWHHPRGGKAKYLEDNLKAMAPRYEAVMAAVVRKATSGR